jgi:hypothetical protein
MPTENRRTQPIGRFCWEHRGETVTRGAKIVRFVAALSLVSAFVGSSAAQDATERAQGDAIVRLSPPVYPAIARTVHVSGDVVVKIGMQKDGKVVFSEVLSGPALLQRAAIDSATASTFDCRGCTDAVTVFSLVYSFRWIPSSICRPSSAATGAQGGEASQPARGVTQDGNRVTVADEEQCSVDPRAEIHRRSWKCLYLWRCTTSSDG